MMAPEIRPMKPAEVLLDAIDKREIMAKTEAGKRNQSPLPASPHHWKYCDFCGDPPFRRGEGVIKMIVSYAKRTGDFIHLSIPSYSLCPQCKGLGFVLTQIGHEAAKKARAQ